MSRTSTRGHLKGAGSLTSYRGLESEEEGKAFHLPLPSLGWGLKPKVDLLQGYPNVTAPKEKLFPKILVKLQRTKPCEQ